MTFTPGLGCGIEHVVVLMFENRSFDNLLGTLYPAGFQANGYEFDGLPLDSSNPDAQGTQHQVWTEDPPSTSGSAGTTPNPDPGERFQNVNYQLYGSGCDPSTPYSQLGVPGMQGFVKDYLLTSKTEWIGSDWDGIPWPELPRKNGDATASAESIMHYFSSAQLPVMAALAKQYAVCDQWFASVPTQTFANRMFSIAASSDGGLDDVEILLKHGIEGYPLNNVFQVLDSGLGTSSTNWRIYYDQAADSYSISEMLIRYVHDKRHSNLRDFTSQFANDVAAGLPAYTLIEPNYGHKRDTPSSDMPNSYHPPFDVLEGEQLLWNVYNTLQTENPTEWAKTLFIVTFDEHGGCYDHTPPPAVPANQASTPPFDRYGVRVPALLISPLINSGTIFRAPSGGPPLDHCSLIRTALQCFLGPDSYINSRDQYAPDVSGVLSATASNPGISVQPSIPSSSLSAAQRESILAAPNHLTQMWNKRASAGSEGS